MFTLHHPNAVMPERATTGSVGYDLTAVSVEWSESKDKVYVDTGVSVKLPAGHFGMLVARSSVVNSDCRLANGVGIIDVDYEGTIKLVFDVPLAAAMIASPGNLKVYTPGSKVGQLVIAKFYTGEEPAPTAKRGSGGFGSTDKK